MLVREGPSAEVIWKRGGGDHAELDRRPESIPSRGNSGWTGQVRCVWGRKAHQEDYETFPVDWRCSWHFTCGISLYFSNSPMRCVALHVRELKHRESKALAQSCIAYTVSRGPELLTQASPGEQWTLHSSQMVGSWSQASPTTPTGWSPVKKSLDQVPEDLVDEDFILSVTKKHWRVFNRER